jgi:hypothetical protein
MKERRRRTVCGMDYPCRKLRVERGREAWHSSQSERAMCCCVRRGDNEVVGPALCLWTGGVECHGGVRNPWISTKTSGPRCVRERGLAQPLPRNGLLRSSESGGDIPAVPVGGDRIKRLKVGGPSQCDARTWPGKDHIRVPRSTTESLWSHVVGG